MSTLKVNELDTKSGTTITVAAGKTLAGNDIIGAAQLATDSVTADAIAANAVDTSEIAANAVTLAEMAGLARGKIIVGDASGDPSALTVGSANQVLTSDGSDAAWAAVTMPDATPRWLTYVGTNQSLSSNTNTTFEYDTEVYDTDSAFNTGTYKFTVPVGEAGVYFGYCSAYHQGNTSGAHQLANTQLKMGSTSFWSETDTNAHLGKSFSVGAFGLAVLAEGDECYVKGKSIFSSGTVNIGAGAQESFFGGWRVA